MVHNRTHRLPYKGIYHSTNDSLSSQTPLILLGAMCAMLATLVVTLTACYGCMNCKRRQTRRQNLTFSLGNNAIRVAIPIGESFSLLSVLYSGISWLPRLRLLSKGFFQLRSLGYKTLVTVGFFSLIFGGYVTGVGAMHSYATCGRVSVNQYCGIARNIANNLPKTFIRNSYRLEVAASIIAENKELINDWERNIDGLSCVCQAVFAELIQLLDKEQDENLNICDVIDIVPSCKLLDERIQKDQLDGVPKAKEKQAPKKSKYYHRID